MRGLCRQALLPTVLLGLGLSLLVPAGAGAKNAARALHPVEIAKGSQFPVAPSFARTADGRLHVAFEENTNWGDGGNGVGYSTVSTSGHLLAEGLAVDWNTAGPENGIPGLAITPGGTLQAAFGGSPNSGPGPFVISSSADGASWSGSSDASSGFMEGSNPQVTLQYSHSTPVLTAGCCGGIVVQQGFGNGSPSYLLTNNSDGVAGNVDTAVDAATGAVIAGWDSSAGSGGFWFQQIAPTEGVAQRAPVPSQNGPSYPFIVAGRDTGPGVFAAYPANYANTTQISLLRYGGGSISVGSVKGLHATQVGVATGLDGRIWVMWDGQIDGKGVTAITRSNKAVTRFEPIQKYHYTWAGGITLSGDGRLGPLDLLIDGTPFGSSTQGIYDARALPVLSVSVSAKSLGGGNFKLDVNVNDAGDPVSGATASAHGQSTTTNATGEAKFTVSGSPGKHLKVTITATNYWPLIKRTEL